MTVENRRSRQNEIGRGDQQSGSATRVPDSWNTPGPMILKTSYTSATTEPLVMRMVTKLTLAK
jgi:hypothetical protein